MNILDQAKDKKFIKEQFIKGRILDDTKDYGRTQFVNEIYTLLQENEHLRKNNEKLKDNWNKLKKGLRFCYEYDYGVLSKDYLECVDDTLDKIKELEEESNSNEQEIEEESDSNEKENKIFIKWL